MQTTFQHPWYTQLSKLESSTTCESELTQKPQQETLGLLHTDAWFAGIYEGEGNLYKHKNNKCWDLEVSMTDRDIVQRCCDLYNVPIYEKPTKTCTGKTVWRFRASRRDLVFQIITDIYPYLGERRRADADRFIAWYSTKNNYAKQIIDGSSNFDSFQIQEDTTGHWEE